MSELCLRTVYLWWWTDSPCMWSLHVMWNMQSAKNRISQCVVKQGNLTPWHAISLLLVLCRKFGKSCKLLVWKSSVLLGEWKFYMTFLGPKPRIFLLFCQALGGCIKHMEWPYQSNYWYIVVAFKSILTCWLSGLVPEAFLARLSETFFLKQRENNWPKVTQLASSLTQ